MAFYLGYSIRRLQVTLIIQPEKSETRMKTAFKADDPKDTNRQTHKFKISASTAQLFFF